jgi:hypothetical protein
MCAWGLGLGRRRDGWTRGWAPFGSGSALNRAFCARNMSGMYTGRKPPKMRFLGTKQHLCRGRLGATISVPARACAVFASGAGHHQKYKQNRALALIHQALIATKLIVLEARAVRVVVVRLAHRLLAGWLTPERPEAWRPCQTAPWRTGTAASPWCLSPGPTAPAHPATHGRRLAR